eukprot:2347432-Rhodomonas_salina.1
MPLPVRSAGGACGGREAAVSSPASRCASFAKSRADLVAEEYGLLKHDPTCRLCLQPIKVDLI